jgi:ABC-type transport system involved in cytochrome bd biosynthesis fused ATPase/permease subunit
MGQPGALRWARSLAPVAIVRRGLVLSALVLAERLLTPAAAWVLFEPALEAKLVVTMLLAGVVTVRNLASKIFAARTEADLTARAVGGLLAGDVLRPSVLSGEDAHIELGQGIYSSAQALSQTLPTLAADLLAAAVLAVVIAIAEPARTVAVALMLVLVGAAVLWWTRSRLQSAVIRAWDLQRFAFDALVDALEGRLEIVGSGGSDLFAAEASKRARTWGMANVHVARSMVFSGRLFALAIAAVVGVFIASGRLRGSFPVTLADLALFASVTPAFAGAAQGLHAAVQAERWLRVVGQIVQGARPITPGKGHLSRRPAAITFEGISFRYAEAPGDADVLRDVAFTCNRGQLLALSGANGSGKSTCLRLLLALASPRAGVIRIDGVDLADLDADAWRSQVAFLPQRPYLPPRLSVRAAIRFLAPDASEERMARAIDRVGLTEALSRGPLAPLDVSVDILSVGQRQRVALARMLCRDASVFLLDEPEANLDRAGIELVAEIVRELAKDHMVIVAVHTQELLRVATEVLELDGGRVVKG